MSSTGDLRVRLPLAVPCSYCSTWLSVRLVCRLTLFFFFLFLFSLFFLFFSFSRKKLDKYICISGSLRCSEHTDLVVDPVVCSQCAKQIDGEVILSVGQKLHTACFKCGFCSKALAKATAKLKDDKLCCPECMLKKDPSLRAKNAAAAAAEAQRGGDPDAIEDAPKAAAAAPAAAVATPVNHDEFTKYVRKPHNRKVSKVREKKNRMTLRKPSPPQPMRLL